MRCTTGVRGCYFGQVFVKQNVGSFKPFATILMCGVLNNEKLNMWYKYVVTCESKREQVYCYLKLFHMSDS